MRRQLFTVLFAVFLGFALIGCESGSTDEGTDFDSPDKASVKVSTIALQSLVSGKYLCADLNRGPEAPLYVDRTAIGPWEKFDLIEVDAENGLYAFRSQATGKYVCAENDGTSRALANRDWIREWETFYIIYSVGRGGTYICINYPRNNKCFGYDTMIPDDPKGKNRAWFKVIYTN